MTTVPSSGIIDFILLDDDDINNTIARVTAELTLGKDTVCQSFTNPLQALAYLKEFTPRSSVVKTILLLDLNMPMMSGWEFLEYYDQLPVETHRAIELYVLTSSIDKRDRDRSYVSKNVVDFFVKPLTKDVIGKIAVHARK